jgi:hypothetical protein
VHTNLQIAIFKGPTDVRNESRYRRGRSLLPVQHQLNGRNRHWSVFGVSKYANVAASTTGSHAIGQRYKAQLLRLVLADLT